MLPPVNSGEEAAELPGLGGDKEGEINRGGKTGMLVKTEEDLEKTAIYVCSGHALLVLVSEIQTTQGCTTSISVVCIVMYLTLVVLAALVITCHF